MSFFSSKNSGLDLFSAIFAGSILMCQPAFAAEIVGIRFGVTSATETRLVFDMAGAPDYDFRADPKSDAGLAILFDESKLAQSVPASGNGAGQFGGYAATRDSAGRLRVALSIARPVRLKQAFVIPPNSGNTNFRLVVDVTKADQGQLAASLPPRKFQDIVDIIASVAEPGSAQQVTAAVPGRPSQPIVEAPVALKPAEKPVIVIDAGHGGTDPGAGGPNGAVESGVTLAAADVLAEILRETGRYEVVLTRSSDIRLAHEERSRIARDARAGLFISLHADAHSDPKIRGGSVYTLSDEGTERSVREALAKGDYVVHDLNIADTSKELGGILYGLAQRDTANASDKFAEILVGRLAGVTPLLNNTHRRGNFKVLLAPDVPAVLLELAFISNKQDEANLQSLSWRRRTMGAAATAIDAYFNELGREKHASAASSATR